MNAGSSRYITKVVHNRTEKTCGPGFFYQVPFDDVDDVFMRGAQKLHFYK